MASREEIADDVEYLTDDELMFLSIVDCGPTKITRIQKLGLFVERTVRSNRESHGSYNYGGYSDGLDEASSTLGGDGAVVLKKEGYELTSYGSDLLSEVRNNPEKAKQVAESQAVVSFFESLNDAQLTKASYIMYPDTTDKSLIKDKMDLSKETYVMGDLQITRGLTEQQLREYIKRKTEGA